MFNIGSQEILIVLLLVFVLFGPRHIPDVAHALGKGLGDLRRALQGIEDVDPRRERDHSRPGETVPRRPSILPPAPLAPPPGGAPSAPRTAIDVVEEPPTQAETQGGETA